VEVEVEVEVVNLEAVAELRLSVELDSMSCDLLFFIGRSIRSTSQSHSLRPSLLPYTPTPTPTPTSFFAHIIPSRPLSTPWDSAAGHTRIS
jgi:hypothetical protein